MAPFDYALNTGLDVSDGKQGRESVSICYFYEFNVRPGRREMARVGSVIITKSSRKAVRAAASVCRG
jgi:hypothetical protein